MVTFFDQLVKYMSGPGRQEIAMKRSWHRISRFSRWLIVGCITVLIVARLALPSIVERYVNRKLDEIPSYNGQIGEVDIHLWRGAYTVHRINIVKTSETGPVPFFSAEQVSFSVQWSELFHGKLVSEIEVDAGKLNFVKGETKEESQVKVEKDWTAVVKDLAPFQINRFAFRDSELSFRDFTSTPKVDLYITNMFLLATNFHNSRAIATNLPAGLWVTGKSLGNGELKLEMRLDPFASKPTFDLDLELRDADLVSLNEMLRAYAKIDVKQGRASIFSEVVAKEGNFEGYVTPLLEDLQIVDLKEDGKNPLKLAWESFVSAMVHLFKNHPKDRLGTRIPVSGSFDNPKISIWSAFINVFHNFVSAFPAYVEGSLSPEDLNKMQDKPAAKK